MLEGKIMSGFKTRLLIIPGTRPSLRNSQLLISTGIPSLDSTIGGGLPIGSIFLIQEDKYSFYAKTILKYFMAEGIVVSQPVLIASQDVQPSQFVSGLPAVIDNSEEHTKTTNNEDKPMKIAWRYQNMKVVDSTPTGGQIFGHYYDLTKQMQKNFLEYADIKQWEFNEEMTLNENRTFKNAAYTDLLCTIEKTLRDGQYFLSETSQQKTNKILRIAIYSLGSRLWLSDTEKYSDCDLLKFLYCFRALLRNSYAVGVVTIPVNNFNSNCIIERIEHLSDIAIALESFAGSTKALNSLYKEYHGLLHIKKLCALNGLSHGKLQHKDLAFKLRRKKFLIEVLHLPPEFEDTSQREQDDTITPGIGCTSESNKSALDF
ncbi:PREDICTED: elongator complex protein 4 isoform X1 [Cyphomyrmex costatus]|uniref:elongator complex protein 4 isoform X1 n=1 Tax=Cyphomyrmex costatus TaxID=456900 RepID=UPI0008523942|nr:PREDICTED: elongator complex protein 4 isoform X1 [Cyphomyrmex costatus]XP_018406506.1 PREDICTED: elongator complex protein 4 isoform X1 [Cyphomyrmex costatus]XP_018406507.1 PREDICTED: elongator complex protein 4 isoform X1 [Cyphomyrmex costatus]